MTTPGCVTARFPCWFHCRRLWGVLWFWWTRCWCAAGRWISRGCCSGRWSCLAAWGRQSNLPPPVSPPLWAAMSFCAVTPAATQRQPWPGSRPPPTPVSSTGSIWMKKIGCENLRAHFVILYSLQTVASKMGSKNPNSSQKCWTVVSGIFVYSNV